MNPQKIAVAGCGVAGLSAGMLLAKAGHDVTIIEHFEEPKSIGAGILLQPSGLVALERLGLLDQVEAKAARIDALIGDTTGGRRVMDVRYADAWPGVYGLGVHRGNLFAVLFRQQSRGRCQRSVVPVAEQASVSLPPGATHGGRSQNRTVVR